MKSLAFLICITFIFVSITQPSTQDTLRLLHVIFRHGDRYPLSHQDRFPSNSNISYHLGDLTEVGKNNSLLLGQWLRHRYRTFLGSYSTDEVKSFNTRDERTLETLHYVLKGLFPPINKFEELSLDNQDRWEKDTSLPSNNTLLPAPLPHPGCTNHNKFYSEYIKTEEYKNMYLKYISLKDDLEVKLKRKLTSIIDLFVYYDFLLTQKNLGINVPDWTKSFMDKIKPGVIDIFLASTATKELKSISAGDLIKFVIETNRFKFKNQLQPEKRKLFLFSAHAFHLFSVLQLWNYIPKALPTFNSCIIFEGYTINNVDGIKVFYKDGLNANMLPLPTPGCGLFCPLSEFNNFFKKYFHTYDTC